MFNFNALSKEKKMINISTLFSKVHDLNVPVIS